MLANGHRSQYDSEYGLKLGKSTIKLVNAPGLFEERCIHEYHLERPLAIHV